MAKAKIAKKAKLQVSARIVLVSPPVGVAFAIQRGKRELAPVFVSTGADLQLDFGIQVERASGGTLRFSGEFVQGPAGGKFVYVNSGTLAGQVKSPWTRRAKVSLEMLKWPLIQRVTSDPGNILEARISGIGRDGGPACASVPLLDGDWAVRRAG
jgi:hypothetical protein